MNTNAAIIKLNALKDTMETNCSNCLVIGIEDIDAIIEDLKE